ncbi:unnamed protein product [Sphenostylis stenocarpa]|uniref:Uncharacterized protein n=1 Tax=Sphenostylis stenocarpa TaxID=92480 RepID=A0AA86RK91_9FABA|nr:unnamed protein product [Sphenostylis stenocarpa]
MKMNTTPTTFFALFLLCAVTSHLPSATADFVFDTDGDAVRNGGIYYVLPVKRGHGGGLERARTGNETCPLTVVQSPFEVSKGLPVVISSPIRVLYIEEGLILNVAFLFGPLCLPTPSVWTLVQGLPEGLAVKLTGYNNTVPGWFEIQRASLEFHDYKFVFRSIDDSWDIGIYIDHNQHRRLVATDNDPLLVQFQKVGSSTA